MDFTLNGRRLSLTAEIVQRHLVDAEPEPVRQHAVRVGQRIYPVKQAFELATGVPRGEFTSHIARRHLAALGFELLGEINAREQSHTAAAGRNAAQEASEPPYLAVDDEWHTEARVQSVVVRYLVGAGWSITSVADTATREHGVDVLARRGDERLAIEVKGFPSRNYADPARAGETKRTQPSTQAKHWYAQAILAAMLSRARRLQHRSVIALPDFPRYRDLYAETAQSLKLSGIEVWWVSSDGRVASADG
jgi:hypothetical protein